MRAKQLQIHFIFQLTFNLVDQKQLQSFEIPISGFLIQDRFALGDLPCQCINQGIETDVKVFIEKSEMLRIGTDFFSLAAFSGISSTTFMFPSLTWQNKTHLTNKQSHFVYCVLHDKPPPRPVVILSPQNN